VASGDITLTILWAAKVPFTTLTNVSASLWGEVIWGREEDQWLSTTYGLRLKGRELQYQHHQVPGSSPRSLGDYRMVLVGKRNVVKGCYYYSGVAQGAGVATRAAVAT